MPPIPVTTISKGLSKLISFGRGILLNISVGISDAEVTFLFLGVAPVTVTNEGQKPSTQLKSLLHVDWLTLRFLPNLVSKGSIEIQFEVLEQSPQPSHTKSLIKLLLSGSSINPLLRRLLFSVAHVWSYIIIDTPGQDLNSF